MKKRGKQSGADHVAGQRGQREDSVKGGGEKTAEIDTVKTELGFGVEMSEADKEAEACANLADEIDVKSQNLKNAKVNLEAAMTREKRTFVKARASSGIPYTFELSLSETKLKIKRLGADQD